MTQHEVRYIDTGNFSHYVSLPDHVAYPGHEFFGLREFDHEPTFAEKKIAKNLLIDAKTQEIIFRGFQFDQLQFSLSDNAQRNWIGIGSGIALGIFDENSFPLQLSALGETQYSLAWADRFNFLGAVAAAIAAPKQEGSILKQAVLDAQNEEELNAIIDQRV